VATATFLDYELDDDIDRIDWVRVHAWLATSYWSPGIAAARVERAGRNSTCVLGAYHDGMQVGYLRVVSDRTRLAYLADVSIDEPHRGRGLGRVMVRRVMDEPDFATALWLLGTRDAHGVYAALGFEPVPHPERWMSCPPRDRSGNLA